MKNHLVVFIYNLYYYGWIAGIEPTLLVPQTNVLPLNYIHIKTKNYSLTFNSVYKRYTTKQRVEKIVKLKGNGVKTLNVLNTKTINR